MKETKLKTKIVSFILVFTCIFYSNVFAEFMVPDFNGVGPQSHINKVYSSEVKEQLKTGDISYDNIDDMIHLYNPEVLNNWNMWKNNKSQQDIYNDYMDAADSLMNSLGQGDLQDGMLSAQADGMKIQADKNVDDSYTNFLKYYLEEKQLAFETKIAYLNYLKSDSQILIAIENLNIAKRNENSANNNLRYGNTTQVDFLTAKKAVSDANSSLILAKSSQNTSRRNIIVNCGRSMNDEANILPTNIDCNMEIAVINFQNDYEEALKNNIQFEIYKKSLENSHSTEVKNEYQILVDAAPQNIYNDLENKYSNILDATDTVYNRSIAYSLANETLNNARNNYSNGNISEREYQAAESGLIIANLNIIIANYDLKIAYETYKAAVSGIANC